MLNQEDFNTRSRNIVIHDDPFSGELIMGS